LSIFPKDAKDKDGQPFWSGPKRAPSPVKFDSSNEKHLSFIVSYSNLIAAALKIDQVHDLVQIAKMADAAETSAYKPKKIEVKLPGEEANAQPAQEAPSQDDETLCEKFLE
jgi:ubiquitin-activating enzyme E1